ncbi:MAG: glycosyltransferase [Bacteroidota bacterium]|nr:glycosyltransferase [Bacteroidota bacterium]
MHTYIFYPLWIIASTPKKKQNEELYLETDELPTIDVLLAAYNEEKVLEEKINTMLNTTYPIGKLNIYIGSDASTDRTNEIIRSFVEKNSNVHLVEFPGRTGKSGIINKLAENATADLFVLTDANVMFFPDTFFKLVQHFKNPKVAQVAANIVKVAPKTEGIAKQEINYIQFENKIKYAESLRWKSVMGAEGGCYAIRKEWFAPVPKNFYMDDFYITMNVIEKGGYALFEPEAICHEDVPTSGDEEFKRKVRISIGNFQNLNRYKGLLLNGGIGFAFISHKVLRWHTPFFLIFCFILSFILSFYNNLFFFFFAMELLLLLSPAFDAIFSSKKNPSGLFRYAAHFVKMNTALLKGFFVWAWGVESNIWTPTKRSV